MNGTAETVKLPWLAASRTSRWTTAGVAVLAILGIAMVLLFAPAASRATACTTFAGIAIAAFWLLVLPNALWLARDARAMRLPTLAKLANASPWVYVLLTVVLPALILAALGAPLLPTIAIYVLLAAACLCFLLLPAVMGSVLFIAFLGAQNLHVPGFWAAVSHHVVLWAAPLAVLATACAAWRWASLQQQASFDYSAWGRPLAWQFHMVRANGYFNTMRAARAQRRTRGWLQPQPSLRQVDPQHPERAIRMAFGKGLMPQQPGSRVLGGACLLVAYVLAGWFVAESGSGHHPLRDQLVSPDTLSIMCMMIPWALLYGCFVPIRNLWSSRNGELPLLALLPGLGSPASVRRSVVKTCLAWPLRVLGVLLIAVWVAEAALHAPWGAALVPLLFFADCSAVYCEWTLACIGNQPTTGAVRVLSIAGVLVLGIVLFGSGGRTYTHDFVSWSALTLVSLAFAGVFTALAWRHWRALQRRPHPFLGCAR